MRRSGNGSGGGGGHSSEGRTGGGADIHHLRSSCRSCGGTDLERFLSLGDQPLANAFLRSPSEFRDERFFPLDVYFCRTCKLVQLLDVIDPDVLFRDYVYVSGTSRTMVRHFTEYADTVAERLALEPGSRVIEVASNDGSLLARFQERGLEVLGIEPAANIARLAEERGVPTRSEFFGLESAERLRAEGGSASAVLGNNVLAHVDDSRGFLEGMRTLLAPGGRVIVEVPYLGELLDRLEYDTIYHEHLCYFSVTALMGLCERAGLRLTRVDRVPVHGGSLRVWAADEDEVPEHEAGVRRLAEREREAGVTDLDRMRSFADRVAANRDALCELLTRLRREGHRLAAYGAPAKGNTLLNYCEIGTSLIPYTVDMNEMKVGLITPGMHLPVHPVSRLREDAPDFVLVLAWNLADEIARQEDAFVSAGGRFLIPIPDPAIRAA